MSEHRNAIARATAAPAGRRRWMTGVVAVLGASGLALGGLGVPVSANDLNTAADVQVSADVRGDCVTAAAGTGQADGSVHPDQDSTLEATGQGTAMVSVCVGGTPPGDPGDPVPGDLDDVVPDDPAGVLNDVVPDDPAGALHDIVAGALEDGIPNDGDGFPPGDPGGTLPGDDGGDPNDILPGAVGGLVPDGHGLVANLLDRLAQIKPPAIGGGGSDNGGGGPATNHPSPSGTAVGSVDVRGTSPDVNAEGGSLTGPVLGGEPERGQPGPVGAVVGPNGSLPRTGGGLGSGVLRLIAFLGLGRALLRLAIRRYSAARLA